MNGWVNEIQKRMAGLQQAQEKIHETQESIAVAQRAEEEAQKRTAEEMETFRRERQAADAAMSLSMNHQKQQTENLLQRMERLEGKAVQEAIDNYTLELMAEGAI